MKTKLNTLGILLLLCLLTFGARATILLQDNFTYPDGQLTNVSSGKWVLTSRGSASSGQMIVSSGQVSIGQLNGEDDNSALSVSNSSAGITNILYVSYTVNYSVLPTGNNGDYFTHFSGPSGFKARLFGLTNLAASGSFRIGIANGSTTPAGFPVDLNLGETHTVVARLLLNNGSNNAVGTLWVDPVNESSSSVTATDVTASAGINLYGFRQPGATSGNTFLLDNLLVGTTFADVVPGSFNPPVILIQPQDTTVFAGSSASFTNLAAGDATLGYQWYSVTNGVTNSILNATNITLTLSSLATNQTGFIFVAVTNAAGTNFTRLAVLNVAAQPIPPTIDTNIMPTASTNVTGDTVTFTVIAHGLPAPAYQWKFIPATNSLVTNIVTGATSATLTLTGVSTNQAGSYFVTITNSIGYMTTNSATATLTVNPPPLLNISDVRAKVDPITFAPTNTTSLFTVQGIVTTWADMTSGNNIEFYMQDGSGGIVIFVSGSNPTNLPPAGALVQVTGPMSSFNGLLELSLVFTNSLHSVTIISTNNPLPAAQPLPFDPNLLADTATMKKLEGSYFVASNVFLASGASFTSGANEGITNNVTHIKSFTNSVLNLTYTNGAGQVFTLFVNAGTDIPGQVKPSGPVTIYGVLGFFTAAGFEFTPSRYADIISYTHFTNILANLTRQGDLPTNTFAESVLRPTESLTTYVSVGDPEGGAVTLTPVTDGLPSSAHWDGVVNGSTATAIFHFQPVSADAGSNYIVTLAASSTSGTVSTNYWYVYVPTPLEQQICISEFLANPTTNTSAPYFNPLQRATDATNITTWDQYVEIANTSATDVDLFGWSLGDASFVRHVFFNGAPQEQLSASNAVVIYGGAYPASSDPSAPTLSAPHFPADNGDAPTLSLEKSGTGVIVLRNPNYYNSGHGIQPGYIVDRVVYPAGNLSTNGSLSRFPTVNSGFVPQGYISTNFATAGLQYDGSPWSLPTKVPQAVTNVVITVVNNQAILGFTADTTLASTLWQANEVTDPFKVVFGKQFTSPSATFSVTNLPADHQFYFITTQ